MECTPALRGSGDRKDSQDAAAVSKGRGQQQRKRGHHVTRAERFKRNTPEITDVLHFMRALCANAQPSAPRFTDTIAFILHRSQGH